MLVYAYAHCSVAVIAQGVTAELWLGWVQTHLKPVSRYLAWLSRAFPATTIAALLFILVLGR